MAWTVATGYNGLAVWRAFVEAVDGAVADTDAVRDAVRACVEEAVAEAPFAVTAQELGYALGKRVRVVDGVPDLEGIHVADVCLAAACVLGRPDALARFEALYGEDIDAGLARLEATARDEARQQLREKLMVGRKLDAYSGYGELRHWLRVVVVRARTDALRESARAVKRSAPAAGLDALGDDDDLELEFLKRKYGDAVKAAFERAAPRLAARERNVLRIHGLEGLSTEQIGALYGVHAATARRWVAAARQNLLDETRKQLRADLGVGDTEFESIVRLAQSRLNLSIPRLLADDD